VDRNQHRPTAGPGRAARRRGDGDPRGHAARQRPAAALAPLWRDLGGGRRPHRLGNGEATEEGTPGDVIYVAPREPHKFTVLGDRRIKMVCIHQAPTNQTNWLE
jgi:hypothetical protein